MPPRRYTKKSQIYGQIFIYLLTIILVAFILIYGYNAIDRLRRGANQVECLKFRNDIKNSIEGISSDFGRIKKVDLNLCSPYRQVCFAETFRKINKNSIRFNINPIDLIIKDSIISDSDSNAFLMDKIAKEPFYAGNITIADPNYDVFCVKAVNGRIILKLEGKGNHVAVSQWT